MYTANLSVAVRPFSFAVLPTQRALRKFKFLESSGCHIGACSHLVALSCQLLYLALDIPGATTSPFITIKLENQIRIA